VSVERHVELAGRDELAAARQFHPGEDGLELPLEVLVRRQVTHRQDGRVGRVREGRHGVHRATRVLGDHERLAGHRAQQRSHPLRSRLVGDKREDRRSGFPGLQLAGRDRRQVDPVRQVGPEGDHVARPEALDLGADVLLRAAHRREKERDAQAGEGGGGVIEVAGRREGDDGCRGVQGARDLECQRLLVTARHGQGALGGHLGAGDTRRPVHRTRTRAWPQEDTRHDGGNKQDGEDAHPRAGHRSSPISAMSRWMIRTVSSGPVVSMQRTPRALTG